MPFCCCCCGITHRTFGYFPLFFFIYIFHMLSQMFISMCASFVGFFFSVVFSAIFPPYRFLPIVLSASSTLLLFCCARPFCLFCWFLVLLFRWIDCQWKQQQQKETGVAKKKSAFTKRSRSRFLIKRILTFSDDSYCCSPLFFTNESDVIKSKRKPHSLKTQHIFFGSPLCSTFSLLWNFPP